jgi:CelD/BcsL family acetyltransferase involved in cellulose biosynthesis
MTVTTPIPRTGRSSLTVERIGDTSGFAALRDEWGQLIQTSNADNLFLTWEWLWTWWNHQAKDRELCILAVRSGRSLVGLAPCCLRSPSLSNGRPLPSMEFLGTGSAGSDYLDIIAGRGFEEESARALVSHLAAKRLLLRLTQLKRGTRLAAHVVSALDAVGWHTAETATSVSPFIPLAGRTWESYLASLSAGQRYNYHRKWRRLERDYVVRLDLARTAAECRESIDLIIGLHNHRWRDRGGSDAFHTPALIDFHRDMSEVALARGWLRLYILRLDGKPAAGLYGFFYRGVFYFYQSGFAAAYSRQSVGLITMGLAIRGAIEEGAEEFDLLHGSEDYKSHWSRHSRELSRLEAYPPGCLGRICQSSVDLGRTSIRAARRVFPKGVFA